MEQSSERKPNWTEAELDVLFNGVAENINIGPQGGNDVLGKKLNDYASIKIDQETEALNKTITDITFDHPRWGPEKMSNDMPSSHPTTPTTATVDLTIAEETPSQQKARGILTLYAMPAQLPASSDKSISIKITTGATYLEWPPREWKIFTPDRKLLAWEIAASQFEYHSTGKFSIGPGE
ncbi:unnamed protein product [Mytilus coruscus]|uniref:Uncharacterized protein n=1 Tax=Mytilus coruscus TaxID=42192 RepID=A0A6J8DGZ1_MYTCO|nr:unnamed protein product [Mytilus coruscus]